MFSTSITHFDNLSLTLNYAKISATPIVVELKNAQAESFAMPQVVNQYSVNIGFTWSLNFQKLSTGIEKFTKLLIYVGLKIEVSAEILQSVEVVIGESLIVYCDGRKSQAQVESLIDNVSVRVEGE
jgi:hypothetical protein